MKSSGSRFKLFFRNQKETLVLIPGWGSDYRIFETLDLNFNYVMPAGFSPFGFERELLAFLYLNRIDKVSLLGWSMGGFAALDFANRYPNRVRQIFLVGARPYYPQEGLEKVRAYLDKNTKGFLCRFYSDWFAQDESEAIAWFKKNLFKDYLRRAKVGILIKGLDYLGSARLSLQALNEPAITFIHGQKDKIAPIGEIIEFKEAMPQATFISMPEAGHAVFLSPTFTKTFREAVCE